MRVKTESLATPGGDSFTQASDADRDRPHGSSQDRSQDLERFERLYKRPGKDEEINVALGEKTADLSSLFQNRQFGLVESAAVETAGGPTTALDPSLDIEKLVDRILISDPAHSGTSEVRLSLSDAVLADTEVLLKRGPDGLLSVSFSTANAGSLQTLAAAQSSLKEALDRHESTEVRLEINDGRNSGDEDASGRRSRGRDYLNLDGD
jgi:type III secretion system needle length determinant